MSYALCINIASQNNMPINITCNPGSTITNKTGGWRTFRPRTDLEHCISCATCARVCPENCITMVEQPGGKPKPASAEATVGKPQTDYDFCKGCGVCASECPVKVIKMELEKK
ncbi:MAG TPA: 4Fe-4S binding protein [Candidatus Nanoarchaeia archaeon]|nr:4Fe-4S binding protein [Candidatus Nanoarchaeia archaeon]